MNDSKCMLAIKQLDCLAKCGEAPAVVVMAGLPERIAFQVKNLRPVGNLDVHRRAGDEIDSTT